MQRLRFAAFVLFVTACHHEEPRNNSIEDPDSYRTATAEDQRGRAMFAGGLSLPVPANATVTYPQGIDSRLMQLSGRGYTLELDDFGAFVGSANTSLAGAPATIEDRSRPGCNSRVMRVRLPGTTPATLICPPGDHDDCKQAPAQATIVSFCATDAACQQVDAIVAGARFTPKPWPKVPLPDPNQSPKEPACRP
jgi:hypothetical protein